jgi:hypothetical protein
MRIRALPLAMLAVLVVPTTDSAPIVLKYRMTQTFEQTVDLTAVGQDPQVTSATYDLYVTASAHDSAGGHAISVKVDSVVPAAGSDANMVSMLTATLNNAEGAGFIDAEGEAVGFPPAGSTANVKSLAQAIYPQFKAGAKPGDVWSDTTETVDTLQGGSMNRKMVTNFTASAGAAWQGEATLKVVSQSSYTVNGGQSGATFTGNGSSSMDVTVAHAGHAVSGQNSTKLDIMLTSPQAPMPIPVTNKTTSAVTLLP